MSNYIAYGDKIAFHPGYYIEEIVIDSGLSEEEFAETPAEEEAEF